MPGGFILSAEFTQRGVVTHLLCRACEACRWAISLLRCILLCSRQGVGKTSACLVRHLLGDFDIGTRLSQIFLYATIILWSPQLFYSEAPVSMLAHPIQDRKERFLVRSVFHPKNTYDRHIHTNFLDQDINKILAAEFVDGASPHNDCQLYFCLA